MFIFLAGVVVTGLSPQKSPSPHVNTPLSPLSPHVNSTPSPNINSAPQSPPSPHVNSTSVVTPIVTRSSSPIVKTNPLPEVSVQNIPKEDGKTNQTKREK